jgi:hypothetical protein
VQFNTRGARTIATAFSSTYKRFFNLDTAEHAKGAHFCYLYALQSGNFISRIIGWDTPTYFYNIRDM